MTQHQRSSLFESVGIANRCSAGIFDPVGTGIRSESTAAGTTTHQAIAAAVSRSSGVLPMAYLPDSVSLAASTSVIICSIIAEQLRHVRAPRWLVIRHTHSALLLMEEQ